MAKSGLLIDYHYCTGCHACEVACQQENGYAAGQFGIVVTEHVLQGHNGLTIDYLPFPTELCTLCAPRTAQGRKPACVKHCLAGCMHFGPLSELVQEAQTKPKTVLYSPR